MASPTCSDHLCAIASDTWFVLSAYFCAFLPWVVISNGDYITEKWRTVRRTRCLARYNVAMSIIPMIYVIVYAEAQRRAHDSKELGAALAALILDLIHFIRTIWGETQLNAFVKWCKRAMDCLEAIQGNNDDLMSESSYAEDDKTPLEDRLMVNESIVDNELRGKAVTFGFSWRKAWEGMKKGNLRPSECLVTEHPQLFSMRWAGALLCGVGNRWWGGSYMFWGSRSEVLNSFYSNELFGPRLFLESVTRDVEIGGSEPRIVSVSDERREIGRSSAYEYRIFDRFESFIPVMETLQSSYPQRRLWFSDNRELAVAGLSESVVLATHMGVEKLMAMRRHFDRARLPTNFVWAMAWNLLLEQCRCKPLVGSALWDMFHSLTSIPFPHRFQMITLWDRCTNWRVLQASAHCDIEASMVQYDSEEKRLFDIEPRPTNLFEYCRTRANNRKVSRSYTLGVVMETIRTFLGEWLLNGPEVEDWEPLISGESFEIPITEHVKEESGFINFVERRFVWECQHALQNDLTNTWMAHRLLPSSSKLIMLFILSMPSIHVYDEFDETPGNTSNGESSSTSTREHSSLNVLVRFWHIQSPLAPQDISIIVRFEEETGIASLSLRYDERNARFKWQDWLDATMGHMSGLHEAAARQQGDEEENKGPLRKVDLRKSMVELSPFYCDDDDSVMKTGTVRVWTGWPASDVRICKFEVDQWMSARNIDMNNLELNEFDENDAANEEVSRAENTIRAVIERGLFDGDNET